MKKFGSVKAKLMYMHEAKNIRAKKTLILSAKLSTEFRTQPTSMQKVVSHTVAHAWVNKSFKRLL